MRDVWLSLLLLGLSGLVVLHLHLSTWSSSTRPFSTRSRQVPTYLTPRHLQDLEEFPGILEEVEQPYPFDKGEMMVFFKKKIIFVQKTTF